MKTVTINLYSFNELSNEAKEKAIEDHSYFLATIPVSQIGELQEDELEPLRDDVIDNIISNDYLFFQDGELAHCTTYTGKHKKAGITEFHFHGQTVTID